MGVGRCRRTHCHRAFSRKDDPVALHRQLDGVDVSEVFADLTSPGTAGSVDLTLSGTIVENANCAFIGIQPTGPFVIFGEQARQEKSGQQNCEPHMLAGSQTSQIWCATG